MQTYSKKANYTVSAVKLSITFQGETQEFPEGPKFSGISRSAATLKSVTFQVLMFDILKIVFLFKLPRFRTKDRN